jgi:hypothetical protein
MGIVWSELPQIHSKRERVNRAESGERSLDVNKHTQICGKEYNK